MDAEMNNGNYFSEETVMGGMPESKNMQQVLSMLR